MKPPGQCKSTIKVLVAQSCGDSLWPHGRCPARLLCLWDFSSKNTGVGLPNPGIEPVFPMSPALAGEFFITSATYEAQLYSNLSFFIRNGYTEIWCEKCIGLWELRLSVTWLFSVVVVVVQLFSHPVVSDCLWPHGLQHARPPCPSPSPKVCWSSCPFHQLMPSSHLILWCPLLLPSIFPSIRDFSNELAVRIR